MLELLILQVYVVSYNATELLSYSIQLFILFNTFMFHPSSKELRVAYWGLLLFTNLYTLNAKNRFLSDLQKYKNQVSQTHENINIHN